MYGAVTWIFVCATVLAVFVAYGIGANDVANAFGSSVGAKALTMKQAIALASICEFGGAVLMGAGVTETIRTGITKLSAFQNDPDILAYGMLCAMMATGIWLIVATYWELPVSTTHSIVGAIIGFTMVSAGPSAVVWTDHKDEFPFLGGVASLCASWVVSPILGGVLAFTLFFLLRLIVLRHDNAYQRAFFVLPIVVFVTFFIITVFIIKGGHRFNLEDIPYSKACWIAAIVGAVAVTLTTAWQWLMVRRRVDSDMREAAELDVAAKAAGFPLPQQQSLPHRGHSSGAAAGIDPVDSFWGWTPDGPSGSEGSPEREAREAAAAAAAEEEAAAAERAGMTPEAFRAFRKSRMWATITHGANYDVHQVLETDKKIQVLHEHSEKFDVQAEGVFKYLQIFTACANSFAHGSNDVSNAVGPYAAIYGVWRTSSVAAESEVPTWVLAMGGAGMVLGLATYGYKIMRVLGIKMTKLTPSRGFVVELSTATIVIIASRYGLPLSTTHTLVGAVTGVGLLEGRRGFNGMLLVRFFAGWVATLVVAALTAAAFTAQGIYAPNRGLDHQRYNAATYLTSSAWSVAAAGNDTATLAWMQANLPNWNASSADWKPMLNVAQGIQAQQMALLGANVSICGVTPAGSAC